MESTHPDRKTQRQRIIAAREALPPETRAQLESALLMRLRALLEELAAPTLHIAQTLGFCWPFRGEPDLRQLVTTWLAADPARRAALPVVVDQNAPLAFRIWTPDSVLAPDRYGIPTPVAGDTLTPALLLIPVNGFDSRGFRLGYGGGYFDRTLESLSPPPLTIGVGYELGRMPHIAEGAHDRPLDWIVTEAGAFKAERDPQRPGPA
ncbi:5-formyltetrahydrofolate cyclo-ligase [Uliginosibacterium sp. H3]|uniref:5-formyltetrahydrofolate cyclo-ligase n=1 Tax=Uliginosibacterium silvisoli TaxID=3114758 RepID=A0ABU6K151_9RHOO|nr:5-formyltetrahydrofolate cyclo-ligase [Uliginosibacterium sp. H3]